jgi:hypothetical protein
MKTIFVSVFIFFIFSTHAQTPLISGGSIRYESIGNNQYKIIATVNRSCQGSAITSLPTITVFSKNSSFNLPCVRTEINNISAYCPSAHPCSIANAISNSGVEQHVFETQIDFNAAPYSVFQLSGNCMVYIGLSSSKRSDSITNISTNNFYSEAMINLCALGNTLSNTSPKQSLIKNSVAGLNFPFVFVHDGIDLIDNDLIDYELIAPLTAHQTKETYTSNLSDTIPITPFCPPNFQVVNCRPLPNAKPPRGFFYDQKLGKIFVTPTRKEVAAVCIRMNEYREINGKKELIGYSSDEFVFHIASFVNNSPPSIIGNNKFTMCEGDSLQFNISTKDDIFLPNQTEADTTFLSWNANIPGSHLTVVDTSAREKTYRFRWKTKVGDGKKGPYRFIVMVRDNQCPVNASAYQNYEIMVSPNQM